MHAQIRPARQAVVACLEYRVEREREGTWSREQRGRRAPAQRPPRICLRLYTVVA